MKFIVDHYALEEDQVFIRLLNRSTGRNISIILPIEDVRDRATLIQAITDELHMSANTVLQTAVLDQMYRSGDPIEIDVDYSTFTTLERKDLDRIAFRREALRGILREKLGLDKDNYVPYTKTES